MATFNYGVLLMRFAEERGWNPQKIHNFDVFCRKQRIVKGEQVDGNAIAAAAEAFEKDEAPRPYATH